jgi:hypothetical protein
VNINATRLKILAKVRSVYELSLLLKANFVVCFGDDYYCCLLVTANSDDASNYNAV